MTGDKLRLRFAKTGTLRLLSHHDLMRCAERLLRRAGLPFKSTAGFHPGPRVVFALPLPLGAAGLDEVVEVEFTREVDADETLAALRAHAPPGLLFTRAAVVPMKATAVPRRVVYELALPPDRAAAAAARCAELVGRDAVWVERLKPTPKRLNIRPYLRGLTVLSGGREPPVGLTPQGAHAPRSEADHTLELDLWVTQTGTARADELLRLLDVADLLDAGAVVARAVLEVRDEVTTTDPADGPPDGPADTRPLDPAAAAALAARDGERQPAAAWDPSHTGPVVE
jgi:radical SAM-linked protein